VATTASDVYMLGGLAYELLTAGTRPFHWLARNEPLLIERLTSAGPVEIPGTDVTLPGLLNKNVLEAAELDRKPIPWCVRADATPGSARRLEEVTGLMASMPGAEATEPTQAARPAPESDGVAGP
jgi:hypothetical protein